MAPKPPSPPTTSPPHTHKTSSLSSLPPPPSSPSPQKHPAPLGALSLSLPLTSHPGGTCLVTQPPGRPRGRRADRPSRRPRPWARRCTTPPPARPPWRPGCACRIRARTSSLRGVFLSAAVHTHVCALASVYGPSARVMERGWLTAIWAGGSVAHFCRAVWTRC